MNWTLMFSPFMLPFPLQFGPLHFLIQSVQPTKVVLFFPRKEKKGKVRLFFFNSYPKLYSVLKEHASFSSHTFYTLFGRGVEEKDKRKLCFLCVFGCKTMLLSMYFYCDVPNSYMISVCIESYIEQILGRIKFC